MTLKSVLNHYFRPQGRHKKMFHSKQFSALNIHILTTSCKICNFLFPFYIFGLGWDDMRWGRDGMVMGWDGDGISKNPVAAWPGQVPGPFSPRPPVFFSFCYFHVILIYIYLSTFHSDFIHFFNKGFRVWQLVSSGRTCIGWKSCRGWKLL